MKLSLLVAAAEAFSLVLFSTSDQRKAGLVMEGSKVPTLSSYSPMGMSKHLLYLETLR